MGDAFAKQVYDKSDSRTVYFSQKEYIKMFRFDLIANLPSRLFIYDAEHGLGHCVAPFCAKKLGEFLYLITYTKSYLFIST